MRKSFYLHALFFCVGLLASVLITVQRVHATLGESADSVDSDRKALFAVQKGTTVRDGYKVQEIDSVSTNVREYISSSGIVFGIAWNGLVEPDLTQLLGSYASEYEDALRRTPRSKGSNQLRVETSRVVVELWGHMRDLQGRAYVPSLVPTGVSITDIR